MNTSFTAATSSNQHGLFRFVALPVGSYELAADHSGFATTEIKKLEITVGATLNVTLRFRVAARKESISVISDDSAFETSSAVSTTVENQLLSRLPVNGRDFTTYALLTPGVTQDARGGLSFGGQRAMNSLLLDGINSDDNFWGQPVGGTGFVQDGRQPYYISQDAVQEFQVNSSSYTVELGRAGGGVINTVTKSGTNEFHGSVFWFYRDKAMNANDPGNKRFGLPKSPFHFNQFGATIGGPIKKDRLFLFGNYEGMRSNVSNGVFLNLPNAFTLDPDPVIAGFQRVALDYLKPKAMSWVRPVTQNDYLGKIDWQSSPRNRFSGTALFQRYAGAGALDLGAQNSFEHTSSTPVRTQIAAASLTSAISDRTINVAHFGYLGSFIGFAAASSNPEANIYEKGEPVLTIGGSSGSLQEATIHQGQWSDVLNHEIGRHSMKIGADILLARVNFFVASRFSGVYDFNSLESFGRNLSGQPQPLPNDDYLQAFSGFGTPGVITRPDFTSSAALFEDQWRVRPELMLNLGLRYDLQAIGRPPVINPSPALLSAGLDTSVLPTDRRNFAPRLGVSWSPFEVGKLTVRTGYGIFYATTPSVLTSRADFQNGISVQTHTFSGGDPTTASLIPQYPDNFCGSPDASGIPPSCAPPSVGSSKPTLQLFSVHYHQPYVQQGDLGVEVQAQKNLSILLSYVVSKGTRLQQIRDVNLGGTAPATIALGNPRTVVTYQTYQGPRPIAGFRQILVFNSDASSIYHGLVVRVNRHLSHNFEGLASYTFSKVLDNNPNVYALNPGAGNDGLIQYPTQPRWDRGLGSNDQRHRFALAGIYSPHYADGLTTAARAVLNGWEISGMLTVQSGLPYSGLLNFDLNNDGDFATDRTPELGRNTFRMPASVSLNPRLTRTVALRKHAKLLLIVEAFNVLNHSNISAVNSNQYAVSVCGSPPLPCLVPHNQGLNSFGSPVASSGARVLQLAARITF